MSAGVGLDVALVTAAPLVLTDVSPTVPAEHAADVAALRAGCADALATALARGAPPARAVALGVDERTTVWSRPTGDLRGLGHPQARVDAPAVEPELAVRLGEALGVSVHDAPLPPDLVVVVGLLHAAAPGLPVVGVSVPAAAPAARLAEVGATLRRWADDAGGRTLVAAPGDLSAARDTTSPGYLVDGALDADERAVAALRAGDAVALAGLGPTEAARVAARGWAPLVVALAAGADPLDVTHVVTRGVGHAVGA
ncbi:MAG: hypothetical protein ACLGIR_05800 [Actinomycetes bacterium]